jgi:AcrR family transcriptional regulator
MTEDRAEESVAGEANARDPRARVIDAARAAFAMSGYARTTMKGVAAAAGVAPDVVRRYYRGKDEMFAAVVRLPTDPAAAVQTLLAPGLEGLGDRLVRMTLTMLDDPQTRADLVSMARAGGSAYASTRALQEYVESTVVDRLVAALGVPDARMRAALISSYLLGIAAGRYALRIEPLASTTDEHVVRMVGPVIQSLLDPRTPLPGPRVEAPRESGPR